MSPIPVTLIAGYLGAGKTTVVNHLLSDTHGMRICVLVNDFGEIALDADLIENRSGDTLALSNGCMCCTIGDDFYDAIDRILRLDPRPEHLVIETSGVADPFKVGQIALAEPDLTLQGVVVVVDAVNFGASLADAFLGETLRNQIATAGLVLVTKSDIAPQGALKQLRATLAELAPEALRLVADYGRVPAEMLLEPLALRLRRDAPHAGHGGHHHDHGAEYRGWVYRGDGVADPAALDALLKAAIPGLYRLKGLMPLSDGGWCSFHRAGAQSDRRPATPPKGQGRAVAVGLADRFDPAQLQSAWDAILRNA
ncbi:CobW family GTP-binding protein [Pararhodobacter zhoushanensis]|uniref:GTP-binding protein n=1 Tax=Pararhodobacter zhoushanensis TaxID=2479545 RepID=A0ABT3GVM1_9RHOB|nr:CobW family GTP-binding protein [Pararhodobacter zhoushanensis]MCW1931589.1 GTP-binding protein [Pararhodobacter zhoushanensis]